MRMRKEAQDRGGAFFYPAGTESRKGPVRCEEKNPKKRDLLLQPMRRVCEHWQGGWYVPGAQSTPFSWCKVCMALATAFEQPPKRKQSWNHGSGSALVGAPIGQ